MHILPRIARAALWALAVVGILAGASFTATAAGLIQPLVVVSGSMEPVIMTGDLVIATKVDTAGLAVGDIISLPSELTGQLVTHRIRTLTPTGDGAFEVEMKGDANEFADAAPYAVGASVLKPALTIPGAGTIVQRAGTPVVLIPAGLGLIALLGLALLPGRRDENDDAVPVTA